MSRLRIAAAIFLTVLAGSAMAQTKTTQTTPKPKPGKDSILPFQSTEKTLANGLKVIVVPTGFPNLVSIQIPVQTGSRNEVEPGKTGFAHFFEHMMFRGTKEYPPDKYKDILTASGARQNAYTTDDFTNYHTTFAKEDLETMLKVEADRFQNLSYEPEAFKTEARAVLGEYNKNSANPIVKIDEVRSDSAFTTHTYKHTTMGFLKDVEDMPNQFEYSKTFFSRWYRPEYTTVIVAGDVNPPEVLRLVEKYWGSWKRGNQKVEIPQEPEPKAPVYAHVPWTSATLPWVTVSFHGPAFSETEKDYAAMDLLMDLYFGETSDIYKRLVEQEQKVDGMFADNPGNADPALTGVFLRIKNLDDAVYLRDEVLKVFAEARSRPTPAKRLADAKANARYGFIRTLDNTDRIAATIARFVRYRRSYDTLNNLFRVYESVTPEDLQAAAKKYFTDNRLVVTTLSEKPMPAQIQTAPGLATLEPGKTGTSTAAGGDVEILRSKSALPQLNVKLLFAAGSSSDPKGKEGLAALTAAMIADGGSKDMRIDEINRALYPMAGVFRGQVDKEMTTFTASVHKDNWKPYADIVFPRLLDPGLREDDFKRIKDSQLNTLKEDLRNNNEEELGKEALQAYIFQGTPYEHPAVGTVAGIESITLDDVRNFIKTAYTRANLTVGARGRRSRGDSPAAEAETWAALPAGTRGRRTPGARSPGGCRRARRFEIIEKETRATAISFGHPIEVTRSHPDYAGSVPRADLARRAPLFHVPPLSAHPRGPRDELRRLRVHRGLPGRHVHDAPEPQRRPALPDLRGLDPPGRSGERAHGVADRDPRAGQAHQERPLAGGLRAHPRLPDEERLRHDRHAGPAARVRPGLGLVRHRRVHAVHAGRAPEAHARRRQPRHPEAPVRAKPRRRDHHQGCPGPEEPAGRRRRFGDQVRRHEAQGAPRRGQGHRGPQAQRPRGEAEGHPRRGNLLSVSTLPHGSGDRARRYSSRTALEEGDVKNRWAFLFLLAFFSPDLLAQSLSVGTVTAQRGQKASGWLEVPAAGDEGTRIPVSVVHGARPGPVLALIAGTHGYEYTSIIALQRLLPRLDPVKMAGRSSSSTSPAPRPSTAAGSITAPMARTSTACTPAGGTGP